ncbi:hypothetical protein BT67DRAFT_314947 [Trichocladium antarcticum]|uniref:Uncharacterized protein n=1 Tax=Trichocladium antarcticum TaxID=1450529 RepID=A0AAN6UJT1_9PEZI|nr:hypothetical protein BT67DRAFT_314947 [Trichocladium antarcticum]
MPACALQLLPQCRASVSPRQRVLPEVVCTPPPPLQGHCCIAAYSLFRLCPAGIRPAPRHCTRLFPSASSGPEGWISGGKGMGICLARHCSITVVSRMRIHSRTKNRSASSTTSRLAISPASSPFRPRSAEFLAPCRLFISHLVLSCSCYKGPGGNNRHRLTSHTESEAPNCRHERLLPSAFVLDGGRWGGRP